MHENAFTKQDISSKLAELARHGLIYLKAEADKRRSEINAKLSRCEKISSEDEDWLDGERCGRRTGLESAFAIRSAQGDYNGDKLSPRGE